MWMKILFAESHNLDRPDPVGSHQYIQLFKDTGHDCLWLGPAVSPMHIFKLDELNRYRFKVWRSGVQDIEEIKWLVPFTFLFYYNLPLLRSLFAGRNQYRFCLPPLGKTLGKISFSEVDLLWCAGPAAYSLIDLVPHRLSCYRLADKLDQFSGIPRNVEILQKELIERVDFVLATSRSLFEWACTIRNEGVYYLPNGVSEIFFEHSGSRPDDFPGGGKPVAVYIGTIDTRFDLDTLTYAISMVPEVHFLLIGPVASEALESGIKSLQGKENFTWLGPKKYSLLPSYLEQSKVGMIPFRLNELTEAVNPIKYYEYMAAGLPVVAPPMRELAAMEKGLLHFYRDRDQFCSALREAVENPAASGEKLRVQAKNHTWQNRFDQVVSIIEEISRSKGIHKKTIT
jgi:glycosyltransferase involved in cell wall biosynthesis